MGTRNYQISQEDTIKLRKANEYVPFATLKPLGDEPHYLFTCPAFMQERFMYIDARYLEPPAAQDIEDAKMATLVR